MRLSTTVSFQVRPIFFRVTPCVLRMQQTFSSHEVSSWSNWARATMLSNPERKSTNFMSATPSSVSRILTTSSVYSPDA